jgi:hypothetical protein
MRAAFPALLIFLSITLIIFGKAYPFSIT